ncbi:unnamed protein product [Rotaria socialis]|uniref:Uncharacterized protein n=1 Tax=Rotaria socialis TaxID=392032 RepID=A0A820YSN9_9BILA|nr:unnamed protein product [Rotaria socialis]
MSLEVQWVPTSGSDINSSTRNPIRFCRMVGCYQVPIGFDVGFLDLGALKEHTLDDFNNTLTTARSISSIRSTTSNDYRNPSQWQFLIVFSIF